MHVAAAKFPHHLALVFNNQIVNILKPVLVVSFQVGYQNITVCLTMANLLFSFVYFSVFSGVESQVSPQAAGINPDIVPWDLSKKLVVYT